MRPSPQLVVAAVTGRYRRTFAEEAGIRPLTSPSGLFRLVVLSLLMSVRIRASVALDAAKALSSQHWTNPTAMANAGWAERAYVLNRAGYARYDERTSRMVQQTSRQLLSNYQGDRRGLREVAGRDRGAERRLLREFTGIGEVGADIFCREAQRSWEELYPFADRRAPASTIAPLTAR